MPTKKPVPEKGAKGIANRAYVYGEKHVATVAFVNLGIGAVLAVFVVLGLLRTHDVENKVTHIENSPCNAHPAGDKCQGIKERSDEKRSVSSACILFYKVDHNGQLLRLTKCPVETEHQKRIEASESRSGTTSPTASASPSGGDASIPSTGHSPSIPHESGGGGSTKVGGPAGGVNKAPEKLPPTKSGRGGHEPSPPAAAPIPPAASSPSQQSSSTTERLESTTVVEAPAEPAAPIRSAVGGVVEGVGTTVQETGSAVNGTVEGLTCTLHLTC